MSDGQRGAVGTFLHKIKMARIAKAKQAATWQRINKCLTDEAARKKAEAEADA